jgi:hypothetical protein
MPGRLLSRHLKCGRILLLRRLTPGTLFPMIAFSPQSEWSLLFCSQRSGGMRNALQHRCLDPATPVGSLQSGRCLFAAVRTQAVENALLSADGEPRLGDGRAGED